MSETFTFDVSYSTTFEDLERLREKMLAFVENERRDYQPAFDVAVVGSCPCSVDVLCANQLSYATLFYVQISLTRKE